MSENPEWLAEIKIPRQSTAIPFREAFVEAMDSLLRPVPSVHLLDWPRLDEITGGFRPNEFTILCGATGSGKTTFCTNLSAQFMKQDIPQFVVNVETGYVDFVRRMMSSWVGEDWNQGQQITLEQAQRFKVNHLAQADDAKMWLSPWEDRFTVEGLIEEIKLQIELNGVKICIIDNLNFFLEVVSAQNTIIEMDRVIHELIMFSKTADVHIIMVMHPKKTENGRVESEFDVKGSSTAVQEAHNVFLFNRPHPELIKADKATNHDRELKLAKMRRIGKHVGRRLVFGCDDGVKYFEKELF